MSVVSFLTLQQIQLKTELLVDAAAFDALIQIGQLSQLFQQECRRIWLTLAHGHLYAVWMCLQPRLDPLLAHALIHQRPDLKEETELRSQRSDQIDGIHLLGIQVTP